jgi:hypothetical protein
VNYIVAFDPESGTSWAIATFENKKGRVSPQSVWECAFYAKCAYKDGVEVFTSPHKPVTAFAIRQG